MKIYLAIGAMLLLASCSLGGLSSEQKAAAACRAYALTLETLVPLKPKMTLTQIESVNGSSDVVLPWCRSVASGEPVSSTLFNSIQKKLEQLLMLETELKGTTA